MSRGSETRGTQSPETVKAVSVWIQELSVDGVGVQGPQEQGVGAPSASA